ncbi:MAG: (Fe-S)-binding protein [Vulcanimicrobiaceae bacterium]
MIEAETRSLDDLLSDCVHCGFCLPACPTYKSWGSEADSPRGRIDLMKALNEGVLGAEDVAPHLDRCLGCMACVPACPSGVRYDLLIETMRARVEGEIARPAEDRALRELVFATFPYPERLRALALPLFFAQRIGLFELLRKSGLLARLPARLAQFARLAPPLDVGAPSATLPERTPARGAQRGTVALVAGCVQRVFFPDVNRATIRVLAAEGFEVVVPPRQGCCGALSLHAGREREAQRFAGDLVERFAGEPFDAVIVNAAGCGSTLKEYGNLLGERGFGFAPRVRDINEFLAEVGTVAPQRALRLRVAYHDACHLANAQRIREQPRALLRAIPELELVEIPGNEGCCGSAGVYNLLQPESAKEIGLRRLAALRSLDVDLVASANPGCTLQLQALAAERGERLRAAHPIELLDAALA